MRQGSWGHPLLQGAPRARAEDSCQCFLSRGQGPRARSGLVASRCGDAEDQLWGCR